MSPFLVTILALMLSAWGVYSLGVWLGKSGGRFKIWHLLLMWGGFLAALAGIDRMVRLAGGFHFSPHSSLGLFALLVMFLHLLWATLLAPRRGQGSPAGFQRFNLASWLFSLIPFLSSLTLVLG